MDMERVLGVYAGYSLKEDGGEGVSVKEDQMAEVLASALNEIEYCMGTCNTYYGNLRAQHGHPAPFAINYVEIGNEDAGSGSYPKRFKYLYDGIKARYPNITIISTAYDENPDYKIDLPKGSIYDLHDYREPSFMLTERFNFFDNWQQDTNNSDVTIMVGEYSVPEVDEPTGLVNFNFSDPKLAGLHVFDPSVYSAVAEAVYLLAMERNPNLVRFSAFAPSLGNMNLWQWKPDLITFDASPSHTVKSVSFYVQKLFNQYRGTHTISVKNTAGDFNPMYWVATIDEAINVVYLKVVNTLNASVPLGVSLDQKVNSVNGTIITDTNASRYNYINDREAVIPRPVDLPSDALAANGSLGWSVPAFSITVFQFGI